MFDVNNDDTLYRFVDGECSPSQELEILNAEQENADLAHRIREVRKANATLRSAMDLELLADLRDDIVKAAQIKLEQNAPSSLQLSSGRHIAILVAASLVVAIGLGTAWSHWRINAWQDAMLTVALEREAALTQAVQQGLENYLSGDTFEISDSSLDFVAAVRPDETYISTSGHWCRSFTERVKTGAKEIERTAIACRDRDTKNWKRMQTVTSGSAAESLLFSDFDSL